MATLGIVEPEGAAQSRASRGHALAGVKIHLLVLHTPPQPFSAHILPSGTFFICDTHITPEPGAEEIVEMALLACAEIRGGPDKMPAASVGGRGHEEGSAGRFDPNAIRSAGA